ncbi:MAG: TonB-dependent receptor [Dysgonamonadaceae bacterium]|jgi:TonB-linked SusC/RagA family outer membrane protein|nr:TonB-dependent receptor [Dysgonamonadaceae bacterium]
MKKLIFLLVCFCVNMGLIAQTTQNKRVTGTVSDESGEPIIGASVVAKGNSVIGTITDLEGHFVLEIPTSVHTLIVKYIGMLEQEVAVQPYVNVILLSSEISLDDVIVVAYGTAKKNSFTGSTTTINAKSIEKRNISTISKALDGVVPGLLSTSGGGQPGDGASVVIRGYGSVNASNNPLYVVDGVPYDGALNAINSQDIESITVLKDASAATLYGNRGSNGVILITTKKGKSKDKPTVQLKGNWGVSSRAIARYNTVNEKEYMEILYQINKNEAIYKNGVAPEAAGKIAVDMMAEMGTGTIGGEQYNPFNFPIHELIDSSTGKVRSDARLKYSEDWVNTMLANNPLRQEYQLSVSGTGEKNTYLISLGYLDEKGLLKTTAFNRFSGRVNLDTQPLNWFKIGLNAAFSQTVSNFQNYNNGTTTANVWYSAQFMAPIYPVYAYDKEGKPVLDEKGNKQFDYGVTRPIQSNWNAIATLFDDKTRLQRDNLSGRTYVQLGGEQVKNDILKHFTLSSNLGFDYYSSGSMIYYNPYNGNAVSSKGNLSKETGRMLSYTWNQLLNYNQVFDDKHALDILFGHEFYHRRMDVLNARKTNFAFGGLYELAAATTIISANSYQDNYKVESYLSRLNYNYAQKYYLSLSFRTDASSRFYSANRWGQFGSVGASWRISEESFLSGIESINNLSLKASYGTQGNDMIINGETGFANYYPWQATYNLDYPNATFSGAVVTGLENKKLSWEKNNNFNLGIEGRFFDRLSFEIEYFNKKTTHLLFYRPKAISSGFDGFWDNVGNMINQGVEISITGNIIKTNDFAWNVVAIGTVIKNKITKLNQEAQGEIKSNNTILKEGEPIYSFYLPKSAGVDPNTGLQLFWAPQFDDKGNILSEKEWVITSDHTKAPVSRVVVGSRIPDLYGSLTSEWRYKGCDLSVLATYSIGGKMLDWNYIDLTGSSKVIYNGNTFHKDALRAWKQPGDITDIPKIWWSQTTPLTDRNLVNASYLALKNVAIGYTFPKKITDKVDIESLRVFAQGDNLLLFNHRKGMDTQFNFSGNVSNYSYIINRSISFGIDLTF